MNFSKAVPAFLLAIAPLLITCTRPSAPTPAPSTPVRSDQRVRYSYNRSTALGENPREAALAISTAPTAPVDSERKIAQLGNALGVSLDAKTQQRKVDPAGEILRLSDGRHRFKLYVPSGMVKYRDTQLYNRLADDDLNVPVLGRDQALARTANILSKLVAAGLVRNEELLLEAARVSHRQELSMRGARKGERERPKLAPPVSADTRVFVPRVLNGIPVSGHGIRLVLTNRGEVAGLDLLWRDVDIESHRQPIDLSLAEAKRKFEGSVRAPQNAMIDVTVAQLVYFDPGMRHEVAFLEPAFLFVYQVRTPLKDRSDYSASKLLHFVLPATAHGRTQIVSRRDLRYAEVAGRLGRSRAEQIKQPRQQLDDDEKAPAGK